MLTYNLRDIDVGYPARSSFVVYFEHPPLHKWITVDKIGQLIKQIGLSVYIHRIGQHTALAVFSLCSHHCLLKSFTASPTLQIKQFLRVAPIKWYIEFSAKVDIVI